MTNFQIGTQVKVNTPDGIVVGVIAANYRNTNINQFAVSFNHESSGCAGLTLTFSKKTGLLYNGNYEHKAKGYKITQ